MSTASYGHGKSSRMRCATAKDTASMNTSLPKSSTEKTVRKRRASMARGIAGSDHARRGAAGEAFAQPGPVQVELDAKHHQPPQPGRRIGGVVLTIEVEHSLMK